MKEDEIILQLRQEFIDSASDRVETIDRALDAGLRGNVEHQTTLALVRREAHSIKGMAGSLGFPIVSQIAHRLEDFIEGASGLDDSLAKEIGVFLDKIDEYSTAAEIPSQDETTQVLRSLPYKGGDGLSIEVNNVEVLVSTPSKVAGKIVRTELQNCGFRVVRTDSAIDIFNIVVRSKPDAVVMAATMNEVNGVDLARAFDALSFSTTMPIGILTSYSLDHPMLQSVPEGVTIIRTGAAHFADDMGDFLYRLQIEI